MQDFFVLDFYLKGIPKLHDNTQLCLLPSFTTFISQTNCSHLWRYSLKWYIVQKYSEDCILQCEAIFVASFSYGNERYPVISLWKISYMTYINSVRLW